jgi:hypothetical protein
MLDYLKNLDKPFDILDFLPYEDDDGNEGIKVEAYQYADAGESVGCSEMGHAYHIIIFKLDEDESVETCTKDHDFFDGILIEPREYLSRMIPNGWFGVLARKTTTSSQFAQETFDRIKAM